MDKIFFKPWIGDNYHNGGIFGKRILILGESHYCGNEECRGKCGFRGFPNGAEDCADFTTNVMNFYLSGEKDVWTPTYLKFERSLVNFETSPEDSCRIWNSVAFYNYLQVAMGGAREGGTYEDYQEAKEAFGELINELKPELIIVWGTSRLYDNLPSANWLDGEDIIVNQYSVKNGYYKLNNGDKSRVVAVYHPSTGYDWEWWYKVLNHFLE